MIIILFLVGQMYNFDRLYNTATTSLVQFQEEQKAAFDTLITLGQDTAYADTVLEYLVDRFDTKSAIERHRLKDIFVAIGPSTIPAIVSRLDFRGSDAEDRHLSQALWVLSEIGGDSIVDPVSRFVHDASWHIRSSAFTALGKSKSSRAHDFIIFGLSDTITPVRKSAYYALSEIARESDIPYFKRGILDPYYGVRYASIKGIIALDSSAYTVLTDLTQKSNLSMFYAAYGLCDLGLSRDMLQALVKSPLPQVRFLVYTSCKDVSDLKIYLEQEENTSLKNFIMQKLIKVEKNVDK